MTTDNDDAWIGRTLDGTYKVQRVLGRGGMGLVLAVEDLSLGERFALKVIAENRVGRTTPERRFLREAEFARRMRSPHILEVYRVGQLVTGESYILMEYLEGEDLGEMVARRGALPSVEAAQYIIEACAGLGLAHGLGIIHRDIKPSNLFLTQRPNQPAVIKLIDFGISKYVDGAQDLTRTNVFLGSPLYMSPEQISAARRVDARSDLFSLGVVFYQLITGVTPFAADNVNEVGQRILHATPVPPTQVRPNLPWQVDGILEKCLAKLPEERYQNAAELSHALEALRAPAAAVLERYLDSVDDSHAEPARPETLSCSFTSSIEDGSQEPGGSIFNRSRAIAARGYSGSPLVSKPRPIERAQPKGPTFEASTVIPFGVPIPENPYFIGRDAAIAALYDNLCKQEAEQNANKARYHSMEGPVQMHVVGPAGIGKSEFMAAYARRHRDMYPGGVLWVDESHDIQEQITNQLGGWKPQQTPTSDSTSSISLALLGRARTLVVFETQTNVPRNARRPDLDRLLRGDMPMMTSAGRFLATHHFVHISRTLQYRWYPKHILGPIDDLNAMAELLLSLGNRTRLDCDPTSWRAVRSIARALHGSPTFLQLAIAALASRRHESIEQTLNELARQLSTSRPKLAAEERALRVLVELISNKLSVTAKSLLRTLGAFSGEPLSHYTLSLLAGIPFADIAPAMDELAQYKLVQTHSKTQASIAAGFAAHVARAMEIDATFRRDKLMQLAHELSRMDVIYQVLELNGYKTLIAELTHFIRTAPTSTPAAISELKDVLELAAPCLMSSPNPNMRRHSRHRATETPATLIGYPLFLAQLRDAAMELDCRSILARTEAALREHGETWLARRTFHRHAAPRVLGIHNGAVSAVAISANGKRAVSGSDDGSVFFYDVESRSILAEHRPGSKSIRCLAISGDGSIAIHASEGAAPEVWNLERRQQVGVLEGHHGNVYALAITSDGRRALTAAEDGLVCAWDLDKCRPLRSLCPYPEYTIWTMFVGAIAFDDNGLAIVASPRGTIWYFDVDTGAVVHTVEVPEPPVGIGHTPSHTLLYARKSLDALRFRNARTGELVGDVELWTPDYIAMEKRQSQSVHESVARMKSAAEMARIAVGGDQCFVASKDCIGRAYSLDNGELLREFFRPWVDPGIPPHNMYGMTGHTGRLTSIAASLDGQTSITGGTDNMVLAWNVAHGPAPRYDEELHGIAVTPDGKLALIAGGTDPLLVVWDVAAARPIRTTPLPNPNLSHLVIAGKTAYIFAGQHVNVWDFIQGTPVRSLKVPTGDGTTTVECVSSDGQRVVLRQGNRSPSTRLFWDIARSTIISFDTEPTYWATFLDREQVLLLTGERKYVIADFATGSIVEHIDGFLQGNGPVVAVCNNSRTWWGTENGLSLVDLNEKSVLKTLPISAAHSPRDSNISSTPDGRFIVVAGDTIQVWSTAAAAVIAELKLPFGRGRSIAITPDGQTIILAGIHSGRVEKYPIPPPQSVGTLQFRHIHQRHMHFIDITHPPAMSADSLDEPTAKNEASTRQS